MTLKYITHIHTMIMHTVCDLRARSETLSYNTKSKRTKTHLKSRCLSHHRTTTQQNVLSINACSESHFQLYLETRRVNLTGPCSCFVHNCTYPEVSTTHERENKKKQDQQKKNNLFLRQQKKKKFFPPHIVKSTKMTTSSGILHNHRAVCSVMSSYDGNFQVRGQMTDITLETFQDCHNLFPVIFDHHNVKSTKMTTSSGILQNHHAVWSVMSSYDGKPQL